MNWNLYIRKALMQNIAKWTDFDQSAYICISSVVVYDIRQLNVTIYQYPLNENLFYNKR